jgi:hypothetical protein
MSSHGFDEHQRRRAENEALFRQINERLESVNEAFGSVTGTFSVLCECDDAGCLEQIELEVYEYEQIRSDSSLFVVVRGHASPDVEDVVSELHGWQVVRKRPGTPANFASATDPRS